MINFNNLKKVAWYIKPLFWIQKIKHKKILLPTLTWAQSPLAYLSFTLLFKALTTKRQLCQVLQALVMIRISQINSCAFCIDMNSYRLKSMADDTSLADEITHWKNSSKLTTPQKIAIEYAECVTTNTTIDQNLKIKLKEYFNDKQLIQLTALIAFQNMSSKFNTALELPSANLCKPTTRQDNNNK